MASSYTINLVNGIAGDPSVCVNLPQLGESILFDTGELNSLSNKDILKIQTVCISHTHVDHFIGFDRIIRVHIPHFRKITVIGPSGIAAQVRSKILAYTWNLLEPGQINYRIFEVHDDLHVSEYELSNDLGFCLSKVNDFAPPTGASGVKIPLNHLRFEIFATILDHGTSVCGFALKMPDSQTVSTLKLEELGLIPGPWIGDLQKKFSNNELIGPIKISDQAVWNGDDLAKQILIPKIGKKIIYLTDIAFSKANLEKISRSFQSCDVLICETNYRHEHEDRALQKKHLTTRHAAIIATLLKAKKLQIFHVSNIYGNEPELSEIETKNHLDELNLLEPEAFQVLYRGID
ncbi:MAG: hypothetical protein NT027_15305 [Proteobacteria bacterium]|nr:hypothetical protein [Pseudomonadota bacterium]